MKFLGRILGFFLNALALLTTQIFIINFLPYPFNQINFIFSVLLAFITAGETKKVFWLALTVSYFLDLFSGSPFGVGIAATLISLFFIKWLKEFEPDLAQQYKQQYTEMIEKHNGMVEVFTADGKPYTSWFYCADRSMLWASLYLTV